MSFDSSRYIFKSIIVLFGLSLSSNMDGQLVRLKNGSFEDEPRRGSIDHNRRTPPPTGWFDCGAVHFPTHTPPDIHKGGTGFWDNEISTYDGKTYLTMVVRDDDSYESISQKLTGTLKEGQCYQFSIFLAQSPKYMSRTRNSGEIEQNFTQPAVLRLWGGKVTCNQGELLAESEPVNHPDWQEYKFTLEPSSDYQVITLEAFYRTPVLFGYNGHICLDGASHFRLIECDKPDQIVAEVIKKEPATKIVPAHKRKKKREEQVYVRPSKDINTDTVVFEKRKKILDLDRSNMKLGLTIKLKKLHFDADKSDISATSFEVLNEITEFLDENPEITIEVGGHTNSKPPEYYCDSLSTVRAKSVADFITGSGIEEGRVTHKGYGKRHPIATNKTERGRKTNQRVQIKITGLDYNMKEEDESGKGE